MTVAFCCLSTRMLSTDHAYMLDGLSRFSFEVSPFRRHTVIRRTAPRSVAALRPGFQFDYDFAVCAVYDAPAACDGPWWELYCARHRRSSPEPHVLVFSRNGTMRAPYVTRKRGGTRNTVKSSSPWFCLDETGTISDKTRIIRNKRSAR